MCALTTPPGRGSAHDSTAHQELHLQMVGPAPRPRTWEQNGPPPRRGHCVGASSMAGSGPSPPRQASGSAWAPLVRNMPERPPHAAQLPEAQSHVPAGRRVPGACSSPGKGHHPEVLISSFWNIQRTGYK